MPRLTGMDFKAQDFKVKLTIFHILYDSILLNNWARTKTYSWCQKSTKDYNTSNEREA